MRNFYINRHLSAKLCLGILMLAIPIFVLSLGLLFVKTNENIRQEAGDHAESVLNTSMHRMERFLNAVVTATNVNVPEVKNNMNPDSLLALTHRILRLNAHVDGCSISLEPNVFPKYGRYYSAYSIRSGDSIVSQIEPPYDYFHKEWYKTPIVNGGEGWVDYYDSNDSLEMTLDGMIASYGCQLRDENYELLGVISCDLSLKRIAKLIEQEKPYPNAYFIMLGEEGRYLATSDSTRLFAKTIFDDVNAKDHADIIALGHEMIAGNRGRMEVVLDGVPSLVCYMPLPGTPWSLALVCPNEDIMYGYHQFAKTVVIILGIGLLITIVLGNRVVSLAIRPLKQLLEKSQSVAEGKDVYIQRTKRQDAVGRLQNSFSQMLQSQYFHMGIIKYVAEQTRQRNKELVEATQMVAEANKRKTVFIQNVTHQIRTPLNVVMGFAQVFRDAVAHANADDKSFKLSDEEMSGIGHTMKRNAALIRRMVLMLFDSSDMGLSEELNSNSHDIVRCNEVVSEAISFVRTSYIDINIVFKTELDDDFTIRTSHLYLMRSLCEIVYNAAKYSDRQHVVVRVDKEDDSVRFIVEDTGTGIDEKNRELMFEMFTKIDDLTEGLGLGLPLAKRHLLTLGGKLKIDDDYHDGCRVIMTLPI